MASGFILDLLTETLQSIQPWRRLCWDLPSPHLLWVYEGPGLQIQSPHPHLPSCLLPSHSGPPSSSNLLKGLQPAGHVCALNLSGHSRVVADKNQSWGALQCADFHHWHKGDGGGMVGRDCHGAGTSKMSVE